MSTTDVFKLKGGFQTFPKNPPDSAWYGIDVTDLLAAGVTIVEAPDKKTTAVAVGVTLVDGPVVQGNKILAYLTGLDVSKGDDATPADNGCTFGFYLSTGDHLFRSIHFMRKDK
jgi:hypothetical protein